MGGAASHSAAAIIAFGLEYYSATTRPPSPVSHMHGAMSFRSLRSASARRSRVLRGHIVRNTTRCAVLRSWWRPTWRAWTLPRLPAFIASVRISRGVASSVFERDIPGRRWRRVLSAVRRTGCRNALIRSAFPAIAARSLPIRILRRHDAAAIRGHDAAAIHRRVLRHAERRGVTLEGMHIFCAGRSACGAICESSKYGSGG